MEQKGTTELQEAEGTTMPVAEDAIIEKEVEAAAYELGREEGAIHARAVEGARTATAGVWANEAGTTCASGMARVISCRVVAGATHNEMIKE